MVSKARAKGNINRRKTITMLEEDGYIVAIVERTGRFIFPKDMFGLWDLVAMKKTEIKFIQVSTNKPHSHKALKEFAKKFDIPCLKFEQWTWKDRQGLKRWEY